MVPFVELLETRGKNDPKFRLAIPIFLPEALICSKQANLQQANLLYDQGSRALIWDRFSSVLETHVEAEYPGRRIHGSTSFPTNMLALNVAGNVLCCGCVGFSMGR